MRAKYGDGDHRDLHSFPTRRSSDLCMLPGVAISPVGTGGGATGGEGRTTSFVREAGLTSSCVIAPDWNLSRTVVLLGDQSLKSTSQVRGQDGRTLISL